MIIGLAISAAILLIVGRTDDPLVEITLTDIAAYGSFLVAENFHASGIISALTAGLLVGSGGTASSRAPGRERVHSAWEFFAFLANSIVFILIGSNVATQPLHLLGYGPAASAILLVLVSRAVSIYPLAAFRWSRWVLPASFQHMLVLGRAAGRARPCAGACRAGERPGTRSDHPHRLRRRRLLDPRPGPDHAVADQALRPRRKTPSERLPPCEC